MNGNDVSRYQSQANERKTLYFEQPEVQQLQATVKRLTDELKAQVDENC